MYPKDACWMANSVDPDQEQSDLDLHCLPRCLCPKFRVITVWLIVLVQFVTIQGKCNFIGIDGYTIMDIIVNFVVKENNNMRSRLRSESLRFMVTHQRPVWTISILSTDSADWLLKNYSLLKNIWDTSWDYGTYHIGDQWRLRRACVSAQSCKSLCCSHTWRMEVDKRSDQKSDI